MKIILLTGGTGYLGSQLAQALVSAGHRVAILIRKSSQLSRIKVVLPNLFLFYVEDGLEMPFQTLGKVDAIIHMATCYGRYGETSVEVFQSNTLFPIRLFEVAIKFGVSSFFNTDTFLNNREKNKVHNSLYALSKYQFNEWGRNLGDAGLVKFINFRLAHLYGPLDADHKFLMYVARCCLKNVPEIKLTYGEQTRDFIHVEDVVRACVFIFEMSHKLGMGYHDFDIGVGEKVSVREFVNKVHTLTNSKSILLFGALPYKKDEVMESQINTSKLLSIGWRPQISLNKGLQHTIELERISFKT
jgi:CDP-paratose synthetase